MDYWTNNAGLAFLGRPGFNFLIQRNIGYWNFNSIVWGYSVHGAVLLIEILFKLFGFWGYSVCFDGQYNKPNDVFSGDQINKIKICVFYRK